MEKVYKGIAPMFVETDDIESLSNVLVGNLDSGDVVIVKGENGERKYVVSLENEALMNMTYVSSDVVETIVYEKGESGWTYSETKTTELGGGGLEVIEWDGERTLTNEEVQKIKQFKAILYYDDMYYYLSYIDIEAEDNGFDMMSVDVDGSNSAYLYGLVISKDEEEDEWLVEEYQQRLPTKLYLYNGMITKTGKINNASVQIYISFNGLVSNQADDTNVLDRDCDIPITFSGLYFADNTPIEYTAGRLVITNNGQTQKIRYGTNEEIILDRGIDECSIEYNDLTTGQKHFYEQ